MIQGDTCLYDAIKFSADLLVKYKPKYENAAYRILCITDGINFILLNDTRIDIFSLNWLLTKGHDSNSKLTPVTVASFLQSNKITLDSVMIDQGSNNVTLKAISKSTGIII